jgi:hypothetical protein
MTTIRTTIQPRTTTTSKLRWAEDRGNGYIATVSEAGAWDLRFYIIPGIMDNPATLWSYRYGPEGKGTIEECKAIAEKKVNG